MFIINYERDPKLSLYCIGAIILEILKENNNSLEIETIFEKVRNKIEYKISINILYLALDWLFLISLIELEKGRIILKWY